ncbi:aspartate aminotransferase family protein [Limnochorda sp.]|uniref:aspartate aminotransferase family protein n=1 Tax=Limnochorda sp. TaxID=1940279 RepID=UPI001D51F336|nr:putrescine aminotransferase [Bacillota bacterium]MBO2518859.1 putrescine aminotransferase [Bacillota bacterium]
MERITLARALAMGREEARALDRDSPKGRLRSTPPGRDRLFIRAEGCRLWDDQGQVYLDFAGQGGTLSLGHNPAPVLEAVRLVAERPNLLQVGLDPVMSALMQNLAALAPEALARPLLTASGREAIRAAVGLARRATGRPRILVCEGASSDLSLDSWAAEPPPAETPTAAAPVAETAATATSAPPGTGLAAVPYGDLAALEEALAGREVAAFVVEPIQVEAGVLLPPPGYLQRARTLCRERGTLFIVDERRTGLGRTGTLFACQAEGIEPDILCLGPSLGGGVEPLGAVLTTEALWRQATARREGRWIETLLPEVGTRAAAAGLATLESLLDEGLPARAAELGAYLLARLESLQAEHHTVVKAVRGRGFLVGLEFEDVRSWATRLPFGGRGAFGPGGLATWVAGELLQRHRMLTHPVQPQVLLLAPPLTIGRNEIDQVVDALGQVLAGARPGWSLAVRSALTGLRHLRGGSPS